MKTNGRWIAILSLFVLVVLGMWFGGKKSPDAPSTTPPETTEKVAQDAKPAEPVSAEPLSSVARKSTAELAVPKGRSDSGCRLTHFRHKHSGKTSADLCSRHGNEIALPESIGDTADISCVRVDGKAVEFKRNGVMLTFDTPVHPDSDVTVLSCRGKAGCPAAKCKPSGDAFLSAIGAGSAEGRGRRAPAQGIEAKWDPASPENDADVTVGLSRELLSDDAPEVSPKGPVSVFKQWNVSLVEEGCGERIAAARN